MNRFCYFTRDKIIFQSIRVGTSGVVMGFFRGHGLVVFRGDSLSLRLLASACENNVF